MNPCSTPCAFIAAVMLAMSIFSGSQLFTEIGPTHEARRNSCTPVMRVILARNSGCGAMSIGMRRSLSPPKPFSRSII